MRKVFRHTENTISDEREYEEYYAEDGFVEGEEVDRAEEYYGEEEWDEAAEYYEDESYVEGDETREYIEERESGEINGYYVEEEYIEGEEQGEADAYYAEEEYTEGEEQGEVEAYYAEEEYIEGEEQGEVEAYYAEEEYTEGEEQGEADVYYAEEYIEGEEQGEADVYYAEEEYTEGEEQGEVSAYYDMEEYAEGEEAGSAGEYRKTFGGRLRRTIGKMDVMDHVMIGTGAAVLLLALVTGGVFISARVKDSQVADFASVGAQLNGISVIGGDGILAVADARVAKMQAEILANQVEEQPKPGYNEVEYDRQVAVAPIFTSIQKDLKIKFVNQKTGKLVANVPFSVTVKDPSGNVIIWSDDDMDGIIYKKDIAAGKYQVTMEALSDSRYEAYAVSTATLTAAVQEEIVYKQVDVANEVKKESEVNVAKEDTKKNEVVVESVLTDTVPWVDSKVIANTYSEVSKSQIPDPVTLLSSRMLMLVNQVISGGNAEKPVTPINLQLEKGSFSAGGDTTVAVGKSTVVTVTASGFTEGKAIAYSASVADSEIATVQVDSEGQVTVSGVKAGTTEVTVTANYEEGAADTAASTVVRVTVVADKAIVLDRPEVIVYLTVPVVINATVNGAVNSGASMTAESSDTSVAEASVSGTTITITGVSVGSADIKVKYSGNGEELETVCAVTVKAHPSADTTTLLKDASGNQLYVLEGNSYREATYADYYTAEKFFLKGEAKYCGWQTLNGKIYYFTVDGNKVTGEQIIQGAKYNFDSDGALEMGDGVVGIDVSKWNGTIDWNAVKNSGISFVIIRCGYRGSSEGKLIEDPKFEANIKGATSVGLKVGVYFFTQAVDEIEAIEEASMVLEQIKKYNLSYPIFLDVESSGGRGDAIDKETRTAVCKAFCKTIQNAGYTAGVYANKNWFEDKINAAELGSYKIWLAQYAATPTYAGRYDMWQYRATGNVSGISGDVDFNISYLK